MTEDAWLSCSDLRRMLDFLREQFASERKLRLCAVGFCEGIWSLLTDVRSRDAIDTLARFADGCVTPAEMEAAIDEAMSAGGQAEHTVWVSLLGRAEADRAAHMTGRPYSGIGKRAQEVEDAVRADVASNAHQAVTSATQCVWGVRHNHVPTTHYVWWAAVCAARATGVVPPGGEQRTVLLDIIGNPCRPVAFAPEWRTSTAVSLAQHMYESRDFSAMPILADALQDAGCDNDDILTHCRGPGPHVRGCWVVDLVLGKQ